MLQMADMETSAATEDSIYELVDVNPEPVKSSSKWSPAEVEIKKRKAEIKIRIRVIALIFSLPPLL